MRMPAEVFKKNPLDNPGMGALNRSPTVAQMMARMAVHRALSGNFDAFEDIIDRIEGKATQAAPNKKNNSALDEQINAQLSDLDRLTEGNP